MKVTISPKKSDVIAVLRAKLEREQANQAADQAKLDEVKNSKIIRPGQDTAMEHLVRQRSEYMAQLESRIALIESDSSTEVLTEIEL